MQNIISTTANFGGGSNLETFLTAGLNYHLEHSLFPNISHIHFKQIHKVINSSMLESNTQIAEYKSFTSYFWSHLKYLKRAAQD